MQKTRKVTTVFLFSANILAKKSDLNLIGGDYWVSQFRLGRIWTKLGVAWDKQHDNSFQGHMVDGYSFSLN